MQLTLEQLKSLIATYVDEAQIAVTDFNVTRNNIVGLVDKIGKIVTLDTTFYDKLPELDGDDLPFGKTIEEYFLDLILPINYDRDETGEKALKFYSITHRPVSYSYSFGKKIIPLSIPNNDIDRAVNNPEQYNSIVSQMTKRLSDSRAIFKYGCKRTLLGKLGSMCYNLADSNQIAGAIDSTTAGTELIEGETFVNDSSLDESEAKVALCVKNYKFVTGDTYQSLLEKGVLVELKIVRKVKAPVDTETGEAFIEEVLKDVEVASDVSEGYSLNGNTIGAEMGLKLYVKQGVIPTLKVKTYAGAFNREDLAIPAELKVIKDFGDSAPEKMYAIMIDYRGVRLHRGYEAVRENFNGFGDFVNLLSHMEYTGFCSRNTFVTIYIDE